MVLGKTMSPEEMLQQLAYPRVGLGQAIDNPMPWVYATKVYGRSHLMPEGLYVLDGNTVYMKTPGGGWRIVAK